jgi:signal transduction histidine kinase
MEPITSDIQIKKGIKILLVDDREDNLFSIETILEQDNYTIVKANSGRAALKVLLIQQDFTLILMDVQMPDMNGFETASIIYQRDKLKHIPIIFITAHNSGDENVFQGYKMGAVDFIYKPINPELLRFKVAVFAELYQKNHQLMEQERILKQMNANLEKEIEERKITEEKIRLLNHQLLENNASLKSTIEELDRFAYVASHDLQEPLRKIQVFSDKIMMQYNETVDEQMKRSLDKIVRAAERMQSLIADLLKFSRQTDDADHFIDVDLNLLLNDVVSDMEVDIEKSGALIQIDNLPRIWAIPSQMRQLFQNLLSNGIKFCKKDCPPLINVYLDRSPDMDKCRIIIEDNGIGFDEKYADEIFVVFKRLHSYHEFEGTGVGLSICKKIIEKHNGTIRAEGKPNVGAKFIIELPIQRTNLVVVQDAIPLPAQKAANF